MEQIRQWAISLCMAALVGAVAHMLSPSGSMERMMRIAVSAFFVCAVIAPFAGGGFNLSEIPGISGGDGSVENKMSELQAEMQSKTVERMEESVKTKIEGECEKLKIIGAQISISMDTNEDNCILINDLKIYISKSDGQKKDELYENIKNNLGLRPGITIAEEAPER